MSQPATWTATTAGTGSAVTAEKAAVADKSHYVSGIFVSLNNIGTYTGAETALVTLVDDLAGVSPVTLFQSTLVGSTDLANATYNADQGSRAQTGQLHVNFANPIRVTEGKKISLKVAVSGSYTAAKVNMWGFTATDRTDPE